MTSASSQARVVAMALVGGGRPAAAMISAITGAPSVADAVVRTSAKSGPRTAPAQSSSAVALSRGGPFYRRCLTGHRIVATVAGPVFSRVW
jgi:hypothetical protein